MILNCADPLHSTRSADPDWRADLGTTSVTPKPPGPFCGACAKFYVDPITVNERTLRERADIAIANNSAFMATLAARRTAIASARATATTMTTVSITTFPLAQTNIRSIATMLVQLTNLLDQMLNQDEAVSRQNRDIIRLLMGRLETVDNG